MFKISDQSLNLEELRAALGDVRAGGYVSFEGWVRSQNEGRAVSSLEYEAFAELAASEGERILAEAQARFKIFSAHCAHRTGHLKLGDVAVWVGVSAPHRGDAYRASRYIIDEMKLRLPIWKKEHYVEGPSEWVNCQECYKHSHHYQQHDEERNYYARQTSLHRVGASGQQRLKTARVVVIGAGGLGCPALTQLAVSGVGSICVVDHDRVEISNLARQTLYKFADVGLGKAQLAKEALQALNPFVRVEAWEKKLNFQNARDLLQNCDLVLDCTDNFAAKFLVHDVCHSQGIPLVMASLYQVEGEIQFFANSSSNPGACLRCLWPQIPAQSCVGNCNEAGVLPSVTAVVGGLQAKIGIDSLLGLAVESRKILVNLESLEIEKIQLPRAAECWLCGGPYQELKPEFYVAPEESWEIDRSSLGRDEFQWIDIREPIERRNSPLTEAWCDVVDYGALEASRRYLLICQKGIRSATLTRRLREDGHTHFFSLKKGVEGLSDVEV